MNIYDSFFNVDYFGMINEILKKMDNNKLIGIYDIYKNFYILFMNI